MPSKLVFKPLDLCLRRCVLIDGEKTIVLMGKAL